MSGVSKNMMVRVGADFSRLFGEFKKARSEAKKTFAEIGNAGNGSKGLGSALKGISKDASAELKEVQDKMGQLEAYTARLAHTIRQPLNGPEEKTALHKEMVRVGEELDKLSAREVVLKVQADLQQAQADIDNLSPDTTVQSQWQMFKATLQEVWQGEDGAAQSLREMADLARRAATGGVGLLKSTLSGMGTAAKIGFNAALAGVKPIVNGIKSMAGGIKRVISQYLGFGLVTATMGRLKSIVSETISQNAGLKAQVDSLRASMATALAPAINLVTNAMSALMPYVVGVSNAIGSLISNLFGSGWTAAADGANATAAATGAAAKAQEEYNRQLMGFDEINKLSAPSDSTSGGGGGGASTTTTPVEGKIPGWIGSIAEKIKESIAADDWSILGVEIGTQLEGVMSKAHEWMQKVDFSRVGRGLAQGINGAISVFLQDDAVGIGTVISDYFNAGIQGFTGFSKELDWSGVGRVVVKEVGDFFNNLDWAGLAEGLGSLTGGIATAIGQPIVDGLRNIGDYFSGEIEEAGGNLWLGIVNGIVNAVTNVGGWIKEKIFYPFIDGFKETFGIHSPASAPELLEAAGYIGEGILNGIAAPFVAIKDWVKTHIFGPLMAAFSGEEKPVVEVDISNNTGTLWDKFSKWWNGSSRTLGTSASISNNTGTLWRNLQRWWGSKSLSVATAFSTSTSTVSKWWSNTKTWWTKAKGRQKLASVTTSLTNNAKYWWADAKSWWAKAKQTLSPISAPISLVKSGWTTISDWVKSFIGSLNLNLKVEMVGGLPQIKFGAKGGVVDGATLFGNTVLGEAGPEMIMPLKNNIGYLDILANQIAGVLEARGGGEQTVNVNVVLDGKVVGRAAVNYINGQAVQTGVNPLSAYI